MGDSHSGSNPVNRLGSNRVTIAKLAAYLGLSKGTVSRALNDYSEISENTKARVFAAAEKMGYRPLEHAQAIRTGRIKSIGLILQTDQHDGYGPFLRDFLAGISQEATALGWTLTVASAGSVDEFKTVASRLVEQRKVDGFILPRTHVVDRRFEFLRQAGIPSVLFGRVGYGKEGTESGAAWFDVNGEEAIARLVERLKGFGHRRIGFVGAPEEYNFAHMRRDGYLRGLERAGLTSDNGLIYGEARTRHDGSVALQTLLHKPEPPTAVVFSTDETALGAYDTASNLGLRLGQDISIASYDGAARGSYMLPALTTCRVNLHEAGARLAALLVRRVEGELPEELRELVPAQLSVGGTDGPACLSSTELAALVCKAAA